MYGVRKRFSCDPGRYDLGWYDYLCRRSISSKICSSELKAPRLRITDRDRRKLYCALIRWF